MVGVFACNISNGKLHIAYCTALHMAFRIALYCTLSRVQCTLKYDFLLHMEGTLLYQFDSKCLHCTLSRVFYMHVIACILHALPNISKGQRHNAVIALSEVSKSKGKRVKCNSDNILFDGYGYFLS